MTKSKRHCLAPRIAAQLWLLQLSQMNTLPALPVSLPAVQQTSACDDPGTPLAFQDRHQLLTAAHLHEEHLGVAPSIALYPGAAWVVSEGVSVAPLVQQPLVSAVVLQTFVADERGTQQADP